MIYLVFTNWFLYAFIFCFILYFFFHKKIKICEVPNLPACSFKRNSIFLLSKMSCAVTDCHWFPLSCTMTQVVHRHSCSTVQSACLMTDSPTVNKCTLLSVYGELQQWPLIVHCRGKRDQEPWNKLLLSL